MLILNELVGFGAGGKDLTFSYLDSLSSFDGEITFTFSGATLGEPDSDREIILAVNVFSVGSAFSLSSLTISGITADILASSTDTDASFPNDIAASYLVSARVISGSTGDIVINFSAEVFFVCISIYRATGLDSRTPFDTDSNTDDVVSMAVDVPEGGFVVAAACFVSSGTIVISGVNENLNIDSIAGSSGAAAAGSISGLSAETGRAISFNGANNDASGVAASFR